MQLCRPALICVLTSHLACAAGDRKSGVLLPMTVAFEAGRQCSRPAPKVDGSWQPAPAMLDLLEAHLTDISRMSTPGARPTRIEQPESYYRQYVGIVRDGHELIYINAFSSDPGKDWKTHLVSICDGGIGFWGVLYDPQTAIFSELAVNGPF